jgi:hypothetical protein
MLQVKKEENLASLDYLIVPFTFAPPPCLALISPQLPPLSMEIELLPTVSLLPETNSLLIAPVEMLAKARKAEAKMPGAQRTLEAYS